MPLMIRKNRLREIRKSQGFSGYDLQILSKIPAQDIYKIERGLKKPLPYEKALVAKALGISEDEVFPEEMQRNREVQEA